MRLLVDTCAFLWLNAEPGRLPPRLVNALRSLDNQLFLSAASVWEIAVKWSAGKLKLPCEPSVWIPDRREKNGIAPLPITEEAAAQIAKLQRLHNDPFDRMLVSQAIAEGMIVVTPDALIRQYPVRVLW